VLVDHDEDALPGVRGSADILARDKERRRAFVTQVAKSITEFPKMSVCKPLANILEEAHGGTTFVDDAGEVDEGAVPVAVAALVGVAAALAGGAVRLARRRRDKHVDKSPQRSGVHSREAVAPDRRSM
jgi:hypothetical protein